MRGGERRGERCGPAWLHLAVALLAAVMAVPLGAGAVSAQVSGGSAMGNITVHMTTARVMPSSAGATGGIEVQLSIADPLDQPIALESGCGIAPGLLLRSATTGASFRALPILPGAGDGCHSQETIVQPGSALAATYDYAARGYGAGAPAAPASIPDGLYDLESVVTYRVVTTDAGGRYQRQPDGHLVDRWPARWSASNLAPLSIAGADTPSAAVTSSATSGPLTPKVLVIDFNTSGTSNDGTAALTTQLANALSTASRYHGASAGSAQFQIYATHTENNPPPIVAGTNKGDGTGQGDYAGIFAKYGICNLAASQGVNFVWIWAAGTEAGGPFYAGDFFEWVATGPTFNETYGSNVPNCGHTVVTMGLNYSRDVALAVHSHGHYMENLLGYSFGPIDDSGPGATDMYDLFDTQFYRYNGVNPPLNTTAAGCGDVHFPPNTTQAYDYGNTTAVRSRCATYNPGRPGLQQYATASASTWEAVGCDTSITNYKIDCDQESYLLWWMQNMPGADNNAVDCGQAPMPNWWQYIVALDTVSGTTANSCARVATVTVSPSSGTATSSPTVNANGFSGSERVSIYWDNLGSLPLLTAAATNGAIAASVSIATATPGTHTIYVKGLTSGVVGSVPFTVQSSSVPGAPGKPVVTAISPGMGSATVSWLPASAGDSALTGYTASCLPSGGTNPPGSTTVDPATLSATVSGLANGTRYTCTVTAANATEQTSSDPATVTPGTSQPVINGGFEAGLAPWTATSLQGHVLVDTTSDHSGAASARLCGSNSCRDSLAQTVALPADPLSAAFSFWLSTATQETSGTCYDSLTVQLRTATGVLLQSFPLICATRTSGWVQKSLSVSPSLLTAQAGHSIQVSIRGTTNASNPTTFSVDDVALTIATSSGAPNLLTNGDFENGLTSWFSSSTQNHVLISTNVVHSPAHSLHLCGSNACSDALGQTVTLPSGTLAGTLTYWLDSSTSETTAACTDPLAVQLRTSSGSTFLSAPSVCQSTTGGWVRKSVSLSSSLLNAHAGQSVQVYFRATTNATNPTDYYLDDVALSVTAQ